MYLSPYDYVRGLLLTLIEAHVLFAVCCTPQALRDTMNTSLKVIGMRRYCDKCMDLNIAILNDSYPD